MRRRGKNPPVDPKLLPPSPIKDANEGLMDVYKWGSGMETKLNQFQKFVEGIQVGQQNLALELSKISQQVGPPGSSSGGGGGGGGGSGSVGTTTIVGTHANRLGAFTPPIFGVGSTFFETDRGVLYITVPTPVRWIYAAGVMLAVIASRPADLGTADTGFMFVATDDESLSVWDGSAWIEISGSGNVEAAGYWAPISNGIPDAPEIIFDSFANVVVGWTPTP